MTNASPASSPAARRDQPPAEGGDEAGRDAHGHDRGEPHEQLGVAADPVDHPGEQVVRAVHRVDVAHHGEHLAERAADRGQRRRLVPPVRRRGDGDQADGEHGERGRPPHPGRAGVVAARLRRGIRPGLMALPGRPAHDGGTTMRGHRLASSGSARDGRGAPAGGRTAVPSLVFAPACAATISRPGSPVRSGPRESGLAALDQVPRIARIDSRREPMVASTADGSYPQCAMQLAQRGSLPRPKASQSVVSISSR